MKFTDDLIHSAVRTFHSLVGEGFHLAHGSPETEATCDCEQLEPRTLMALLTPADPVITPVSSAAVRVSWVNRDTAAAGHRVYRSSNGVDFTQVGTVLGTLRAYTDSTVLSNNSYSYKVESFRLAERSAASNATSVVVPLVRPQSLIASPQGSGAVSLSWANLDPNTTSLQIMRSTDGRTYSPLVTLDDETATTYLDETVLSGVAYTYTVRGVSDSNTSMASIVSRAAVPLQAPSNVQTTVQPRSVSLSWSGLDPRARNYVIMRATGSGTFGVLATLGATATTFTDSRVATGTAYVYKVRATNLISTAGVTTVNVTTPLMAPGTLTAAISGPSVSLTWADSNRAGVTYVVSRSTDGTTFSDIGQVASKRFTDTTADRATTFTYRVKAVYSSLESDQSGTAQATTPDGTSTVTIAPRYGNELVITSLGTADNIAVSQSGQTITITTGGQTFTATALSAGLFVYDRAVSTTIAIDASVTMRTTIAGIGGGLTTIASQGSDVSIWIDSTDVFAGNGAVHRVSAFAGGVSKARGASLANPADAGAGRRVWQSLWGTGPQADDVNQGAIGDCYVLASFAAFAEVKPELLRESAVDLGDGTFAVQFMRSGRASYVRVSNVMPATGLNYRFARPGDSGSIWSMVMEKAWAYHRRGLNTYASIASGWMGEVYSALGVSWAGINLAASENSLYTTLASALSNQKAVTFGTSSISPNLVRGHAYTLIGVEIDGSGATRYLVRNPWGVSGNALENADGYATLSYSQLRANFNAGVIAA